MAAPYTSEGRIVTGPVRSDSGDWWTTVTLGTLAAGANALTNLLGTVGLERLVRPRLFGLETGAVPPGG